MLSASINSLSSCPLSEEPLSLIIKLLVVSLYIPSSEYTALTTAIPGLIPVIILPFNVTYSAPLTIENTISLFARTLSPYFVCATADILTDEPTSILSTSGNITSSSIPNLISTSAASLK